MYSKKLVISKAVNFTYKLYFLQQIVRFKCELKNLQKIRVAEEQRKSLQ